MSQKILSALLAGTLVLLGVQFADAEGHHGPVIVTIQPQYPTYSIDKPPHFALHPPVYYSHPVKRSYGLSPYASSGNCTCGHKKSPAPAPEAAAPAPARQILPKEQSSDPNRLVSLGKGYKTLVSMTAGGHRVKTIVFD